VNLCLLLGEVQLRQALGRLGPLDAAAIARRTERAFALTCRLYAAPAAARTPPTRRGARAAR
jgi:hypothetical protein